MASKSSSNRRKNSPRSSGTSSAKTAFVLLISLGLLAFIVFKLSDDRPQTKDVSQLRGNSVPAAKGSTPASANKDGPEEHAAEQRKESVADKTEKVSDTAAEKAVKDTATEPEKHELTEEEKIAAEFPMHAVAFHIHSQIREKPESGSRVIAYARRGSAFRVSERVSTTGCKRGWHRTVGDGYLCDGEGFNVGPSPMTFSPSPPSARVDNPLPYEYRFVRSDNVAEYWKIPSPEEVRETAEVMERLKNRGSASGRAIDPQHDEDALKEILARASAIAADGGIAASGEVAAPPLEVMTPPVQGAAAPAPPVADPFALPEYVHLRLAKGYFVSVDSAVDNYIRTIRGRYIPANQLSPASASSLKGSLISTRNPLPIVFVVGSGVSAMEGRGEKGPLKEAGSLSRYDRFPLLGEVTRANKKYYQIGEGRFVAARVASVARQVPPPSGIGETDRWIDVNLTEQTLVAYEGPNPIFATVISSGRENYSTPPGKFHIYGKHVTITMDDPEGGDEAYSIEDVPWTQYFNKGYALHAAFWHDRFGRVRSHGCINLSPGDARRLFFWTGPDVPPGTHGTIATRSNPGTLVVIHD